VLAKWTPQLEAELEAILGTKPAIEPNWKTFGAGVGRRDAQLYSPPKVEQKKSEPAPVSATKCLEDHCKVDGTHNHSKIIEQHIQSLGEGEGINYKMMFKEEDNSKYFKKHLCGSKETMTETETG